MTRAHARHEHECVDPYDQLARHQRIKVGVGRHLGRVDVELATPDQAGCLTLLHDAFEKAPKHVEAIAVADARQAGVVRQGLVKVVAEVPAHAQAIRLLRRGEPATRPQGGQLLAQIAQLCTQRRIECRRGLRLSEALGRLAGLG